MADDAHDPRALRAAIGISHADERRIAQDLSPAIAWPTLILAAANKHAAVGDTQTLAASKAYTDQKFAVWNDTFAHYQQQVDLRFDRTDARIDRSGAMQTAMAQMTASAAGVRTVNRMAVGVGAQNGKAALSLGYQRALGDKAALTIGAAFSGNERSAGVGYGFGW